MELLPGTQVTDNVRLVAVLGEGGMGSVWVADHLSLKTRVAVKFLSAELVREDPNMLERFNREAALSARIKSPYVVQTFDHGVMRDGRPFIVMELLEGESLADRLERTRMLPLPEAVEVVSQVGKALSKAHKLGIVHRDIKPDNLFLTYDDDELHLKVLDFGIAKQTGMPKASSVTSTGMMVGTPEYMSPEQVLSARSVDARSDLWALGVVAYHCLTGGVPFTGETLGALCVAIANGQFIPPTRHRPELPSQVDAFFVKALAKDPEARFASAKELAVAFARAVSPEARITDTSFAGPMPVADWSGQHAALSVTPGHGAPHPVPDPPTPQPSYPADPTGPQLPPPHHSPTFAGATMTRTPRTSRRMAALVGIGATLLVAAGVTAAVMLGGGTEGAPEADVAAAPSLEPSDDAPESSAWADAEIAPPPKDSGGAAEVPSSTASSAAGPEPAASSSAGARAATPPSRPPAPTPSPPPRIVRPVPPPPPPPPPKQKDRGF